MLTPIFVFSFVIATLTGALFHLFIGGGAQRLAIFLVVGWVGFGAGQAAGVTLSVALIPVGELRLVPAVLGSLFALVAAWALTSPHRSRRSSR